jgi:hypothetical protein
MAPSKSAIFSSLLLGYSGLVSAAKFVPFEVDLLYPKNATYASGFQGLWIVGWNETEFTKLGLQITVSSSLLDLGQNPPKVLNQIGINTNTGGSLISQFVGGDALAPGQYSLEYTLSIPQTCNNGTGTNFFNITDSVVFTMSNQPGALHPNGSDFFVGGHPCRAISVPIDTDRETGDCSMVDVSNAGPVVHDKCPYKYTASDFEEEFKSLHFDPDIPFASQTTATTTMRSSTSSGLGMMATPFPGVVAAGVGLVGLGAALL